MPNKAKGFVIDSFKLYAENSSDSFSVVNSGGGSVNFSTESMPINSGWSMSSLLSIDTKNTLEIQIENAELDFNVIKSQLGSTVVSGSADFIHVGEQYKVATNAITIPFNVKAGSLKIAGLTETTGATPTTGQFKMTVTSNSATVTFFTGEFVDGAIVTVSFKESIADASNVSVKSSSGSGIYAVTLQQPVYNEDNDNSQVVGYLQIFVKRAKIKKELTLGSGYKSHQSYNLNLEGLDPKDGTDEIFKLSFIPKK